MFRNLQRFVRLTPSFTIPIISNPINEHDQDLLNTALPDTPTTGLERVKRMFQRSEYDELSVELNSVAQASLVGAFTGAVLGGFIKSREAYLYFIENNQATIFKSTRQAQKKLQDYVTVAFCKGAYRWGWRLGAFMGMFSLATTTIQVYRNETSLVDYIAAGAITGAMYKANLGMAAMMVGAVVGGVLSSFMGLAVLGILKVTGFSLADIRRALYRLREARQDQFDQAQEKAATIKHDDLTRHHDSIVEEVGQTKIDEL